MFYVLMMLSATGCMYLGLSRVEGYSCTRYNRISIKSKSLKSLYERFANSNLDEKYAIYICQVEYTEPPLFGLEEIIAKEGEKAVGYLTMKLIESDQDIRIHDIVHIFAEMSRQNTFNVAADTALMYIIESKINTMGDGIWKQRSEQFLKDIKERKVS